MINNFKRIIRITVYANKQLRKISSEFDYVFLIFSLTLICIMVRGNQCVRTNKTKLLEINEKEKDTIELKTG